MSLWPRIWTPDADALCRKADAARDRREWAGAARLYRASLAKDDRRADLWVQLGHALKESGDRAGAEQAYGASLDRAPDVADTHLQLGHLLKLVGRRSEAAVAYARAVELDPKVPDAFNELRALVRRGVPLPPEVAVGVLERLRPQRRRAQASDEGALVFDVSDLLGYFRNARLPTGIQRVQIEVIRALLTEPPKGRTALVCAFAEARDDWVGVTAEMFLDLVQASLAGGPREAPDWRALVDAVTLETEIGPTLVFPSGAWLINLGTSWWLQNYFLKVREAQARHGVRYLPFVHDMIPIMAPEHCVRPLTQDFISWTLGVFAHADRFLTNSEASARDLMAVAARLGHEVRPDQIQVVRLDADFRAAEPDEGALERLGLPPGGYMLFVSTIESRKNHVLALKALQTLIARHGAGRLPKLVCVGNRGWLNDAVFARLEGDRSLRKQVVMLSGLPDATLAALYRDCLFTLYPSGYEGWGLPVTESLSWGRPVLASDSSSLPEAGGEFAVYAPTGNLAAFTEAMERLIFDQAYRAEVERRIESGFRPRPWRALADDILQAVAAWSTESPPLTLKPMPIELGRFYPMSRPRALGVHQGMINPEAFRVGEGWGPPDDLGAPIRGSEVRLEAALPDDAPPSLKLYLGLRGCGDHATRFRLGEDDHREDIIQPGQARWFARTLELSPARPLTLRLRLIDFEPGEARLSLLGWMVCDPADGARRADMLEAIATGDFAGLASGTDQ